MMKQFWGILFVVALVLGFSFQAQATLTTIGKAQYNGQNYNLIWENDSPTSYTYGVTEYTKSIVWLDYTKSADTWQNEVNWAAGLNNAGVLTYNIDPAYSVTWSSNWYLPWTDLAGPWVSSNNGSTPLGYNITDSAMGHLFYTELGNKGYCSGTGVCPQSGWGLSTKGPFSNLTSVTYWSGTKSQYIDDQGYEYGMTFSMGAGAQSYRVEVSSVPNALAVRGATVTVAVAPEPISSVLFLAGGATLIGRKYIRRKKIEV